MSHSVYFQQLQQMINLLRYFIYFLKNDSKIFGLYAKAKKKQQFNNNKRN